MSPRIGFDLLLITDGTSYPEERLEQALVAVPMGRVAVQLRNRSLDGGALLRIAMRLRTMTRLFATPLFVNDRLDVALAANADGVHLPGHGIPPRAVRERFGDRLLVSAAAHSLPEAQTLVAQGAHCLTFGPIWPTPSKPDDPSIPAPKRVVPLGPQALAEAARAIDVPLFALGGIDTPERAAACAAAGARIACLRGVLGDADAGAAATAMLDSIRRSA